MDELDGVDNVESELSHLNQELVSQKDLIKELQSSIQQQTAMVKNLVKSGIHRDANE